MNPYFKITVLPLALAGVFSIYLMIQLIPVARKIDLIDKPSARKKHASDIPLIGGIAIFIAISLSLMLSPFGLNVYRFLIFGAGILMIVGVLDDHQDISAKAKFFVQIAVAAILVFVGDVVVASIGDIFNWRDGNEQGLGWLAQPLTIIAIVGVINAFNMIDGHDGLAASVFLVTISPLIVLCSFSGDWRYQYILCLFFVCVVVFIFFNLGWIVGQRRRIFLGDAGSMLLGFVLSYSLIVLAEGETQTLKRVSVPWLIGLPLFDIFSVVVLRIGQKVSVIKGDRRHIHHLLTARGLTKYQVLLILVALHAAFCAVGLSTNLLDIPDWIIFWLLFPVFFLYIYFRHLCTRQPMSEPDM